MSVIHVGSNGTYASGWDAIFGGNAKRAPAKRATPKAATKKTAKKAAPKKAAKKKSKR